MADRHQITAPETLIREPAIAADKDTAPTLDDLDYDLASTWDVPVEPSERTKPGLIFVACQRLA